MPHTGDSTRQALCIGLSRFGGHEDEPPPDSYADLPHAQSRVDELAAALTGFGYTCQTLGERDLRSAEALGAKVTSAIGHAAGEAQIIHVLSHGHRSPDSVYVVGADGEYGPGTSVAAWVALVQDSPADRRPHTLFLIDTCLADTGAARLDWLPAAGPDTRAWVIAATPGGSPACDGRFSQAVANVLTRIQTGNIDFYPTDYIPFGHVVEHIRREVVTLGGDGQYVCSTPVDANPEPPFFPNPRPPLPTGIGLASPATVDTKATVDAAIQPFTELDLALGEAHFLDRATGPADPAGRFGGREHELQTLTAWLDDPDGGALRLITGGPGSGKSALLGLLVCAAHPALRDRTRRLWEHVPGAPAHPIDDLAAVHLRERDLTETLAALTRQLALPLKRPGPNAATVVAAITAREHPPVIVFDALDEALTQTALIQELLLPLAAATRPDGRPACRLLVGMRPSEQFAALRDLAGQSGAVIDLDEAELDLDGHASQPWFRPILLILAHARGAGMPATVIRRLAPLCRTYPSPSDARGPLTVTEFDQALRQVRFYLRSSADTDGTTLYRLCHQSLVAQLRDEDVDHGALAVALLATAPKDAGGGRHWAAAEPYVQRHGLQHAADAGHLDELLPVGFAELDSVIGSATTATGRVTAACLESAGGPDRADRPVPLDRPAPPDQPVLPDLPAPSDLPARRDILAVNAVRYGSPGLASRLSHVDGLPEHRWWPAWATGGELPVVPRAVLAGPAGQVRAVACAELDGRWVAVTVGGRSVRVWDLLTGRLVTVITSPDLAPPSAVACTELAGRAVAVTGGDGEGIQVWDLGTGQAAGQSTRTQPGQILAVACAQVEGRDIAVTASAAGTIGFWDLADQSLLALLGLGDPVTSVACAVLDGRTVAVVCSGLRKAQIWDVATRELVRPLATTTASPARRVVACCTLDGRPIAVTGGSDGAVRFWDLTTGQPATSPHYGHAHGVGAVACVSSGGRALAMTGGNDGTVRLWDVASGQPAAGPLRPRIGAVTSLAGREVIGRTLIVAAGPGREAYIWDADDRRSGPASLPGHSAPVSALTSVSVGGRRVVVSGGYDRAVQIWDGASGRPIGDPVNAGGVVFGLRWSGLPSRRVALTLHQFDHPSTYLGFAVAPFDATYHRRPRTRQTLLAGAARGLASTTVDGRPVVVTANIPQDRLGVWDLSRGRLLRALSIPSLDVTAGSLSLACTQIGGTPVLITADRKEPVRMWNLATGEPTGKLITDHGRWIKEMAAVTVSGRSLLVAVCRSQGVAVWNLEDGLPLHKLMILRPGLGTAGAVPLDGADVQVMTCGPVEGRALVVIGDGRSTVRVWDLLTGRQLDEFTFPGRINALALTEDGDLLVGFGGEVACLRRAQGVLAASL